MPTENRISIIRRMDINTDAIIEFLRFCRCKKWFDMSRLGQGHQRYRSGLKKCLKAQCHILLCTLMLELNSWDSVDAKNGLTCQDWTKDTRDTDQVLKSVLKHNAAFCCAHWCHNWIPEILQMQKMFWHVKIGLRTPEIQIRS